MKENEDIIIEREKVGRKRLTAPSVIGLCVLILIAVMVLAAVISSVSGVSVAEIGSSGDKGALVYDVLPDSITDIESYSSGLVMLTDTALVYLDSNGKNLSSNSHQYSQPVMVKGGSTVLLYDKGGTSFRIEKNSKIYNTYTTANAITVADVNKKGDYAYVLNEDGGFQSHLYVYSYRAKKLFEWGSAQDYCINTAISENGKNIALSMLGVKNGEYISRVIFFNVKDDEAAYIAEFPDCTVFRLEFLSGKNIAAFTDNGVYVIDKKGNVNKRAEYIPTEIMHSSVSDKGLSAIALASHGNTKDSILNVFDKKMNSSYLLEYSSEIMNVRTSDKYTAVLLGDRVETFNAKGEKTGSIVVDEKCTDAAFAGRKLFLFTVSGIYRFELFGDYKLSELREEETTGEFITEEITDAEETTATETIVPEEDTEAQNTTEASSEETTAVVTFG